MPTIAIVEPHYDDAWLSLGGTILQHPEVRFSIVSVSRDDEFNPVDTTRALAERFGHVETRALELLDLGWQASRVRRRARRLGLPDAAALFARDNGLSSIEDAAQLVRDAARGADLVLLPLGLFHPMHDVVSRLRVGGATAWYFEYPYGYYESQRRHLEARTEGLSEHRIAVGEVVAEKLRVFREVYPAQAFVLELPECAVGLEEMVDERIFAPPGLSLPGLRARTT